MQPQKLQPAASDLTRGVAVEGFLALAAPGQAIFPARVEVSELVSLQHQRTNTHFSQEMLQGDCEFSVWWLDLTSTEQQLLRRRRPS